VFRQSWKLLLLRITRLRSTLVRQLRAVVGQGAAGERSSATSACCSRPVPSSDGLSIR
jgi:hypothetical protein